MERQKLRIANTILQKNKVHGLIQPDFHTYQKTIVIKTITKRRERIDIDQREETTTIKPTQIYSTDLRKRNEGHSMEVYIIPPPK